MNTLVVKTALILDELFNFDGQLEELCAMSEIEGEFGMDSDEMIETLKGFVAAFAKD